MQRARFKAVILAVAMGLAASASPAFAQDKKPLRIGYWTSGFSLGFGAVLQEGGFLKAEGVDSEFRSFGEVSAPAQAVLTGDIDIAFGAPSAAAFNLAAQGAPIRVFLVTQILEGQLVVPKDSPITKVEEFKGKRIGMSRPGSSTHALVTTILSENYGLKPDDYKVVPGNEGPLSQLILRGDIDVSSLRSVTIAQMPKDSVKPIIGIVDEWLKLTKSDQPPALAVAMTSADYLEKNPEAVAAAVRAIQKAVKFGSENKEKVAEILEKVANMKPEDARNYASVWDSGYTASFSEAAIAGLKRENEIFVKAGAAESIAPDTLYADAPFKAANKQ